MDYGLFIYCARANDYTLNNKVLIDLSLLIEFTSLFHFPKTQSKLTLRFQFMMSCTSSVRSVVRYLQANCIGSNLKKGGGALNLQSSFCRHFRAYIISIKIKVLLVLQSGQHLIASTIDILHNNNSFEIACIWNSKYNEHVCMIQTNAEFIFQNLLFLFLVDFNMRKSSLAY